MKWLLALGMSLLFINSWSLSIYFVLLTPIFIALLLILLNE